MPSVADLPHAALTRRLIGTFFDVYNELGCGFLESVYAAAMRVALADHADLHVEYQPTLDVTFRGRVIGTFRADFVIDRSVVVELKAGSALTPAHDAQLLNYLRASGLEVGLLMNFGPKPVFRRLIRTVRGVRIRP